MNMAARRHQGEQLGHLAGMGADIEDDRIGRQERPQDRDQLAMMLPGQRLEEMGRIGQARAWAQPRLGLGHRSHFRQAAG